MSNKIMPMPVDTPVIDRNATNALTVPWQMYLKALGDDALSANMAVNARETRSFKYVVNGCLVYCVYYQVQPQAEQEVTLPYTALLAFQVLDVVYPPGTKTVVIPANTEYLDFQFVAQFVQQGA
jgi:hypothetical protein